ncbi:restriction endonuclease subunit S [Empedobacter falsenii]
MTKTTTYKNTPIGPIPTEWQVKKLGEVFKISAGGDIKKENVREYHDDTFCYPVYANASKNNGLYGYSNLYKIDKPSLTISGRGEIGIAKARYDKYYPIVRLLVLQPNLNLNLIYIENYINSINLHVESTGVPQLTAPQISKYEIPLPPLPEQQKIAEVLSTWDKAIQETDAIIKKLEARNKALAYSLLTGKKRVNGFEDKWDNYKLDHFLEEYSSKPNGEIDLPVFTSSKNGLMNQSDYYSGGRISSRENVDYNIIPDGYITYRSRSDDGLFTFNKNTTGYDGLISGYYPVFKIVNGNDDFFLFYLNFFKNKLTKYSTGTSQLVLSFKALKSATFHLPSLEEQNAIAAILNTANQELKQYQQKLQALKLQKKGLMQQLLTGKVRTV